MENTNCIGSSDVAGILGESPWSTPWSVWSRLVGLTKRDSGGTTETEDGNMLEPGILARYARERSVDVIAGPPVTAPFFVHREHAWMGCHPDGFVLPSLVVEAKAPRTLDTEEWGPHGSRHVPRHYALQSLWLMAVLGMDRCDLVAYARYDRDDRWRIYPLERKEQLERIIIGLVSDWREAYVLTNTPPPVDGTNDCAKALASMHTERTEKVYRTATEGDLALARDLLRVRKEMHALKESEKLYGNLLRASIGDAYGLKMADGTEVATHGVAKGRASIDSKLLKAELPEVAAKYTKVGAPSRRFRFTLDEQENDNE